MTTTTIPAPGEIYGAALDAIPDYTSAETRRHRLDEWLNYTPHGVNAEITAAQTELTAAIERVADGEELDLLAIGQRIVDLEQKRTVNGIVAAMVQRLSGQLSASTRDLDRAQQGAALGYLNTLLAALVTEVRSIDGVLGGVVDAPMAFRGTERQLSAWKRLDQLVETYDAIRAAQELTLRGSGILTETRLRSGLLADAIDRERGWVVRRIKSAASAEPRSEAQEQALAWLAPAGLQAQAPFESATSVDSWWPDTDRHRYLRWACTSAHPWVPTPEQLQKAQELALIATDRIGATTVQSAREYYRITGATSTAPLPDLPPEAHAGATRIGSATETARKITVRPRHFGA